MNNEKTFSIRARVRSFKYAFEGIFFFFRTEHNARLHLLGTIMVASLALVLRVSRQEAIALIIVAGLVWITEIINTVVEKIMDFVTAEQHPEIKFIKDLAAAAVLVAAFMAAAVGCFVFIPKL